MDFLKILKGFEDFIFEATSWLIFYPLTLWRVVTRPLAAMEASDREQHDALERQYDDGMSPPLLLLITLILTNGLAVALHVGEVTVTSALTRYIMASVEHQILFRSLLFSLPPLVAAASLVHGQGKKLNRENLRTPFYAQCYLAAPTAIVVGFGIAVAQRPDWPNLLGETVVAVGAVWFLWVQSGWFARHQGVSRLKGLFVGTWALARAVAFAIAILIPVALI